jgi:hypothetical protein
MRTENERMQEKKIWKEKRRTNERTHGKRKEKIR